MADATDPESAAEGREPDAIKSRRVRDFDPLQATNDKPQSYYDAIKQRFADERNVRLAYRPEGRGQYITDLADDPDLARYQSDPHIESITPRAPIVDTVDVVCIGGGFSGLLVAARLREAGIESIRIVERGSDVGGAWYWNRYPGVSCDVPSYDYLPLLDEIGYVPPSYYTGGAEIFSHCQEIARRYDLYKFAVFQTTVNSTEWDEEAKLWRVATDRGDRMVARFVVLGNGNLSEPKLPRIQGMEKFEGKAFHTSRFDYDYAGADLSKLKDKVVGIIGTGASAVQIIPRVGAASKALYVFQRTPSAIDIRDDTPTDPVWAKSLKPGWQLERRLAHIRTPERSEEERAALAALPKEERARREENMNIEHMMRIHRRIEEIVQDPATAEALKPWYMHRCKRPLFDDLYLPAYNLPQVHLVNTKGKGITEINERGPVFEGKEYPLDCLIYATGFNAGKSSLYNRIAGVGGLEITDKYRNGIETLFGIHSHDFPNLFIMNGLQTSYQYNLTFMLQTQADYIAYCLKYMKDHGYQTMDVKKDMETWWVNEVVRTRVHRLEECTPGYLNFEGEKRPAQDWFFGGSFLQYNENMDVAKNDMERYFDFA